MTSIPPASERAYVVFVKAWSLGPKTPANLAQALIDQIDNLLLGLADKARWYPSPYGGAIAVDTVVDAMNAAGDLLSSLTSAGVEVGIAVGRGRLDRVQNVNRWNVTALAMNRVARIVSLPEARGHVLVDPTVCRDAILAGTEFEGVFGPERSGEVKRTQLTYHQAEAPRFLPSGSVLSEVVVAPGSSPTVDIVCFDIERYSEQSESQQNLLVRTLSMFVERMVAECNCEVEEFAPAGDGGYIVFRQRQYDTTPLTWRFARGLADHARAAQIPLRVGISTGPVCRSKERPAVGGAILRADAISSLPSCGDIAVANEFWVDLQESFRAGWSIRERSADLQALAVTATNVAQSANPRAFYSGHPASDADIAGGLDVPRTQYVREWTDELGHVQRPWRESLLRHLTDIQAESAKVLVVALYGHRGSGKTTLSRRMIHELRAADLPVVDLLGLPLGTVVREVAALAPLEHPGPVHVFLEIDDVTDVGMINEYASLLKQLSRRSHSSVVHLGLDTNSWQQIEARIRPLTQALGGTIRRRHLRGSLDQEEVGLLTQLLKSHRCLFRLEHKTDEGVLFAFRHKAKRGLLTALIEATRGTDAAPDLRAIVRDEYLALSERGQWAYSFVAIFHASGLPVPGGVLQGALQELFCDSTYFASASFVNETREILLATPHGEYLTRHRLIAESLLKELSGPLWQGHRYRLLSAALKTVDPETTEGHAFFDLFNEHKLARHLTDPAPLVEEVVAGAFPAIRERYVCQFLNSVARIYQGRRQYEDGERLAQRSLSLWSHIGNQASYLQAFCQQKLGRLDKVKDAVGRLLDADEFPYHVLHGVALLVVLRDWTRAKKALDRFLELHGSELWRFPEYGSLRHKVDVLSDIHLADRPLDTLAPTQALERIQVFEGFAEETAVIEHYQALLRRQHDFFTGFLAFFTYMYRSGLDDGSEARPQRLRQLEAECRYHIGQHDDHRRHYPDDVLSLLHSNLARSLFEADYIGGDGYPHETETARLFESAIRLKTDNWYAHNWYATFLKEVRGDQGKAESRYRQAVSGDPDNPVFRYNLALLLFEERAFKRRRLDEARATAAKALAQCQTDARWRTFAQYPAQLLSRLSVLTSRADIAEGEELEKPSDLPADAG